MLFTTLDDYLVLPIRCAAQANGEIFASRALAKAFAYSALYTIQHLRHISFFNLVFLS